MRRRAWGLWCVGALRRRRCRTARPVSPSPEHVHQTATSSPPTSHTLESVYACYWVCALHDPLTNQAPKRLLGSPISRTTVWITKKKLFSKYHSARISVDMLWSNVCLYQQAKHPPFEPPVVDTVWRPNHAPVTLRTLHVKSLKKEDIVDVSSKRIRLRSPRPSVSQASPSGERLEDIGTPVVETVVPEKLASVQQHYLAYEIKDRQWSNNRTFTRVCPFPNNTRGLLYYRKHPKIPLAGSIRFCLARDPQQSDFSRPNNLLLDTGLPWQIDLLNLSASNRYKNLRDILIRDRLVPPQLFRHCSQMGQRLGHSITQWDQLVYEYRQPFFVDLSLPKSPIYLVNCYDIIRLKLQELFSCDVYPFKCVSVLYFVRLHLTYVFQRAALCAISNETAICPTT